MSKVVEIPLKEADSSDLFLFFQERFDERYARNEIDVNEYEQIKKETLERFTSEGPTIVKDLTKEYGEIIASTVITSFGLGPFFHRSDKDGGQVTTIHNARDGVYANEKDSYDKKARNKYKYGQSQVDVLSKNLSDNGYYKDGYTGKRTDIPEVDHIIPLKSFHNSGGYMLTDEAKEKFSSDQRNLIVTDRAVNRSKKAQDLNEFIGNQPKGQSELNHDRFEIDKRRTKAAANRANQAFDEHIPSKLEKGKYYVKHTSISAVNEAFTMGTRQAMGMLLYVFSTELFKELNTYSRHFKQYWEEKRLVKEFSLLVGRVKTKVASELKNIGSAFKEGFFSGILHSIATTIVNCFKTTSKRLVRIMREGVLSILKALKLLLFRPKEITAQEATRGAIKLLISGVVVAGGIIIEELLENQLKALLIPEPIANLISTTLIGILTGITIVTVLYLLDKLLVNLPSTKELIAKSNEIIHRTSLVGQQYQVVASNIHFKTDDNFVERINQTDKKINDLIDFFEE